MSCISGWRSLLFVAGATETSRKPSGDHA